MSAVRKRKLTHLQTSYMEKYEQQQKQAKNKRKGLARRLLVFAVIVGVTSYGIISTVMSQKEVMQAKQEEKEKLQQELNDLKDEQAQLEDEIVKLNNDDYLAKIIRRDYFLSKEGEIIFKIGDGS